MARFLVFYSWQSDRKARTNRTLIRASLDLAAKEVSSSLDVEDAVRITSDTQGVAGAPHIKTTILEKIAASDAFVADISNVHDAVDERRGPNPNVVFELGFAVSLLGWERVVLVMNRAWGPISEVQFDLQGHRVLTYDFPDSDADPPAEARKLVAKQLEEALRLIVASGQAPKRASDLQKQHWLPELDRIRDITKEAVTDARRPWPPFYVLRQFGMSLNRAPFEFAASLSVPDVPLRAELNLFMAQAKHIAELWFQQVDALNRPNLYDDGPRREEIVAAFMSVGGPAEVAKLETAFNAVHARINQLLA